MVKFFKSDTKIWWNKGNEVKPNYAEFQAINWTALNNFNVNYVNETTINVNVPVANEFDLLKIDDNGEVTYWYLERINNKTETNRNCTFTLDLWCTYILGKRITLPYLQTNRTHLSRWDLKSDFSEQTKIKIYGEPTNKFEVKAINGTKAGSPEIERNHLYQGINNPDNEYWYYFHLTKYYVFRTKQTPNIKNVDNGVILIPEFLRRSTNQWSIGSGLDKIPYNDFYFYRKEKLGQQTTYRFILNNPDFVQHLIDKKGNYPLSGLGDFLGIFYGPNYWRINSAGAGNINWPAAPFGSYIFSQDVAITLENKGNDIYARVFACLILTNNPAIINPLWTNNAVGNNITENYLKNGLTFFNVTDPTTFLLANKMSFTNKISLFNKVNLIEMNSEVPSFYDGYFDWLNQSKPQRDNQINIMNQQLGLGIFRNIFNTFTGIATSAAGFAKNNTWAQGGGAMGANNSIMGIASGILQYQNQRRQIEAQKQEIRLRTSSTLISSDLTFLTTTQQVDSAESWTISQQFLGLILNSANRNFKARELMIGYHHTDPQNIYNFMGWETNFKTWTPNELNLENVANGYLKFSDNFNLVNLSTEFLSPTIRNDLTTLLINGVRIATRAEVNNNFA